MRYFLTLLLILKNCICLSQTISGRIINSDSSRPFICVNVSLCQSAKLTDSIALCYYYDEKAHYNKKYVLIQNAYTDSLGYYYFESIKPGIYNILVAYGLPENQYGVTASKSAIDSNIKIEKSKKYTKTFYLSNKCKYDKTRNLEICPKCHKRDQLQQIVVGLPSYNEKGLIDLDNYYYWGCLVEYCMPSKYCKRCKSFF